MKPSALIAIIGIATSALFACVQPPPPGPPPPPGAKIAAGPLCTSVGGITTLKISVLTPGFNPMDYYPADPNSTPAGYNGPPIDDTVSVANSAMADDFSKAFAIAPPFFQTQLCNLDGVFIDPTGCSGFGNSNVCTDLQGNRLGNSQIISASWGFRETPPLFPQQSSFPLGHPSRYIAISAGPWYQQNIHAPVYHTYAQRLLNSLLPWTISPQPTYGNANPGADISAMSVLAALAHEFGHVLWYDTFRPAGSFGSWPWNFDLQTFCHGKFFNASWRRNNVDPPPPWRQFGDVQNSHVSGDTSMIDIFVALLRKQRPAGEFLFNIYRPGDPWASPFAAFSPDEDFIETFKFYVLANATGTEVGGAAHALSSLPIAITGNYYHTANIPNDYAGARKANLKIKTACIQNAFDPP